MLKTRAGDIIGNVPTSDAPQAENQAQAPPKKRKPLSPDLIGLRLIKRPEVEAKTGRSRSAIYSDPTFPKSVRTGRNSVAWVESEVDAWIEQRIADRDARVEVE
jgi:prophage regulatory protein